jgi:Tfp pilus assembly protein PilX
LAHAVGEDPRWEDNTNWDGTSTVSVDYSDGNQQPLYMIEYIKTVLNDDDRLNMDNVGGGAGSDRTHVFRVTALGTGKTASAKVLLQSTYGKKF